MDIYNSIIVLSYQCILYIQFIINLLTTIPTLYVITNKSLPEMNDMKWHFAAKTLNGLLFSFTLTIYQPMIITIPFTIVFGIGITRYSSSTANFIQLQLVLVSLVINAILVLCKLIFNDVETSFYTCCG
uniref:Uncharacterized protein n=1 Tax=Acrobeloides nanus TaxID=290746 RepID=A0A914D076_9BILA